MNSNISAQNFKYLLIGISTLIIIFLLWNRGLDSLLNNIETLLYDYRANLAVDNSPIKTKFPKASKDIIILAVDDATFQKVGQNQKLKIGRWPWSRAVWGNVLQFIKKGNPKAVIFDFTFTGAEGYYPENIKSDNYLAEVLKNSKNVTIGLPLAPIGGASTKEADVSLKNKRLNLRNAQPFSKVDDNNLQKIPAYEGYNAPPVNFLDNASFVGVVNDKSEDNNIIRSNNPVYYLKNGYYYYLPSLPLAAVLSILPENEKKPFELQKNRIVLGKRVIPLDDEGRFLINWHGPGSSAELSSLSTYKVESLYKVLYTDAYNRNIIDKVYKTDLTSPGIFKNKIVIIGETATGSDLHPTTMGMSYPGPEINATVIDNILNDMNTANPDRRPIVTKVPIFVDIAILLIFCCLTGWIILKTKNNFINFICYLASIGNFTALAFIVFIYYRYSINMIFPLIFITLTALATFLYRTFRANQEKDEVKNLFGKFVSPQGAKEDS